MDDDEFRRFHETYVENIVSWATLPPEVAKVETEARTRRLLALLFTDSEEGGNDGKTR